MDSQKLYSVREAAFVLDISEALIDKFINLGFIRTVEEGQNKKITSFGLRQLNQAMDLYEKSFSRDKIEKTLHNQI